MSSWFRETPESMKLLAQERLIVEVLELVAEAMEFRNINQAQLADLLDISQSEVSQRLNGKRNLTLRTLADMLHVLDYELAVGLHDTHAVTSIFRKRHMVQEVPQTQPYTAGNSRIRIAARMA